MAIIIRGAGKALPQKLFSNNDFNPELETSDEWIFSHTGIHNRYVATQDETSAFLATQASFNALDATAKTGNKIEAVDLDLIICATATPEYQGFPANACIVQSKLGAKKAACFDISAACSGFIFALDTATAMLASHSWKYALVIGAETMSKILDWTDRTTCVLFGDGAGAVLLENIQTENTKNPIQMGIKPAIMGSQGEDYAELVINKEGYIRMNGRKVYTFAVQTITQLVTTIAEQENLSLSGIDMVVCHQANARIIQAAAKRLQMDEDKFVINVENYGNTSAASVPITLTDLFEQERIKPGMKVILTGFGAGLSWGGCLVQF